jgi:L-rhamnose mutarotase
MRRHLQLVNVRPEKRERYLQLHGEVWPEVERRLTASNIRNYSIFIHGELLVAYFEYDGSDFSSDLAAIAADPVTQRWWKLTDECQMPFPGTPVHEIWSEAAEVWHLD